LANDSTATALQEDVASAENGAPERTEATARNERPAGVRVGATDLLPDLQSDESGAPTQEVEGGRAYEITYIVQANVANAVEETQARVKALVEESGGAVDNARVSEARRLSYPINKKAEGIYVVMGARFRKDLTEELDRYFKLDERVLRHVLLREDS